jgi:hypothetical protein
MTVMPDGTLKPVGKRFGAGQKVVNKPKGLARRIRDMVGDDPGRIANVLFDVLESPTARDADKIAAARELFDRGWGKAPAFAPIEGGDPLESSELDKAIMEIAAQLTRRAHPQLDAEVTAP